MTLRRGGAALTVALTLAAIGIHLMGSSGQQPVDPSPQTATGTLAAAAEQTVEAASVVAAGRNGCPFC